MFTSHQVPVRNAQRVITANIKGELQATDAPLSDHNAVKAAFVVQSVSDPRHPQGDQDNLEPRQEIPALGFGTHFMPEDLAQRISDEDFRRRVDELTETAVKAAIDAGVRLFESGNRHMNQPTVGRTLQWALQEGKVTRSELFICGRISKCKDREQLLSEVEMLLRELRVDYVDLLTLDIPPEQAPQTWPWAEEVLREGRARHLGVSNFDLLGPKVCVELFREFLAGVKIPPSVLAMEVHPLNTNEEMSECCRGLGIQVMAYSPVGAPHKVETFMQVLTKSDARDMRPLLKVPDVPALQDLGRRYGVSATQVALRWNLQRGHCVVSKSWNPAHILENTQLFHFCLRPEDMSSVSRLHKGVRGERFFQAAFASGAKALPRMTRDAQDECQRILSKIRGPGGGSLPSRAAPRGTGAPSTVSSLPSDIVSKGGNDMGGPDKVDWEKLGFEKPVEESPGFWRRIGVATGKGCDGKGKGKGAGYPVLKDGLPVGGKGVPPPMMVGSKDAYR
ncbi:unnamed protein product [Polarella glacialis]|uniref:NADP-dependent oxidoreductase domain-containing protein n=2 Tax=Polarella glacialis TaxID=89957 RepID=A0A813L723_POLGL|nr:unnamed protein product [Polarella glacialis]